MSNLLRNTTITIPSILSNNPKEHIDIIKLFVNKTPYNTLKTNDRQIVKPHKTI